MNQQALLLFSDGLGHDNDWGNSNFVVFPFHTLRGIKSKGKNSFELYFNDKATLSSPATVTLSIENGKHNDVTNAIFKSVLDDRTAITTIADVGNSIYAHKDIYGVSIKSLETFTQTLTNNAKTKINTTNSNYSSCLITNTHSSAVSITLKLVSQVGSDITDTTINAAEAEAVSTSSVTLNVDGTVPTNDLVLSERIYKSDGTFFGVATSWTDASPDTIVFSRGIENAIANDDDLYTGTRYTLLNAVSIPANTVLKLESDEISFDDTKYNLYAYSGDGSGYLTFTFNY